MFEIVVLTHGRSVDSSLRSIQSLQFDSGVDVPFSVRVLDNGSDDGAASAIRSDCAGADVTYMRLEENRGFTGGFVASVESSQAEYIHVLAAGDVVTQSYARFLRLLKLEIDVDHVLLGVQPRHSDPHFLNVSRTREPMLLSPSHRLLACSGIYTHFAQTSANIFKVKDLRDVFTLSADDQTLRKICVDDSDDPYGYLVYWLMALVQRRSYFAPSVSVICEGGTTWTQELDAPVICSSITASAARILSLGLMTQDIGVWQEYAPSNDGSFLPLHEWLRQFYPETLVNPARLE